MARLGECGSMNRALSKKTRVRISSTCANAMSLVDCVSSRSPRVSDGIPGESQLARVAEAVSFRLSGRFSLSIQGQVMEEDT